ncbi:MAG: NADH-quinone oxidoreductase subunit L [Candidatus Omnitrophica bacterium]|jgi:NADH-quinone oxidoreductase subunit L|nr:NADH-quinone oxidoreductase subunit L [Candidatus Omnitrophota bacterium]
MTNFSMYLPLYISLLVILPIGGALILFLLPQSLRKLNAIFTFFVAFINLILAALLFGKNFSYVTPWLNFGFEIAIRLYNFSSFMLIAAAGFCFLITLYSIVFMKNREHQTQFYSYLLITLGLTNGVLICDNLFLLLFFWEGLLLVLFGMIAVGSKTAFKAASKALIITGICDLCMMIGIILAGHLAGTLTISKIHLASGGLGSLAFLLLMIGAISKAGSMPFHSWIPDAAISAPLPFMALVPAALEKLIGIYFLARISLDMFKLSTNSALSTILMWIGILTIILAVMMALIQKNYKRLLSYHAISQVGYMILGIGTAVPAGIVGGLFHMINHAIYKSGLFLTGGAVEKQTNTTNLEELGGLGKKMPVTFLCFIITAASISGVPPFNGFFSKELVYDGALERGLIFYLAAIAGSFLTAVSFLKLGHTVFLGKSSQSHENVREVKWQMFLPMLILSFFCVLFGLMNSLPLNKIIPIVQASLQDSRHSYVFHINIKLIIATVVVLILALLNHIFGVRLNKGALHASDHIRYAPILSGIYDKAERRFFDPFEIGLKVTRLLSKITFKFDRLINWVYDVLTVKIFYATGSFIRRLHMVNYPVYLMWSLLGFAAVALYLLYSLK